jgi:hypothetical protein
VVAARGARAGGQCRRPARDNLGDAVDERNAVVTALAAGFPCHSFFSRRR